MREERSVEIKPMTGVRRGIPLPLIGATIASILILIVFNLFISPPRPAVLLKYERWLASLERKDGEGLLPTVTPPPRVTLRLPGEAPLVIDAKSSPEKALRILHLIGEAKLLAVSSAKDLKPQDIVELEVVGGGENFSKQLSKNDFEENAPALLLVNLMRLFAAEEVRSDRRQSKRR